MDTLGEDAQTAVYRVAQEALTNAERHAGATVVEVELEVATDRTELRVRDDGGGFDPGRATRAGDPLRRDSGCGAWPSEPGSWAESWMCARHRTAVPP